MNAHTKKLLLLAGGSASVVSRMLKGRLRVVDHPIARTHSYADDTGPRRVLFCSNFCALRDCYDNNPVWISDLDTIVKAGYQGVRIFRILGESDFSGYFAGRTVQPSWGPSTLVKYAKACRERGLRLQLSAGHQWAHQEFERVPWERSWAEMIQAKGLAEVISLIEGDNEYWQNATWRDSDEQIALYGQMAQMFRQVLNPAPFFACGAPMDEAPERIFRASTHSDVCEIHTSRDIDKMVRRPFGIWYWEGNPGLFPKPYWHGEPTPFAGGPDDFMPTPSPGRQIAQFAISQLTGGAVSYFDGWDVRSTEPIEADAATFWTAPQFLAALPEDVATWGHVPGGRVWWWQGPGKRFATVFDEQWGEGAMESPKPVGEWKAFGPRNSIVEGSGPVTYAKLGTDWGGALVVGDFL